MLCVVESINSMRRGPVDLGSCTRVATDTRQREYTHTRSHFTNTLHFRCTHTGLALQGYAHSHTTHHTVVQIHTNTQLNSN